MNHEPLNSDRGRAVVVPESVSGGLRLVMRSLLLITALECVAPIVQHMLFEAAMDSVTGLEERMRMLRTLSMIWNVMGLILLFGVAIGVQKMRAFEDRQACKLAGIMQIGVLLVLTFDSLVLASEMFQLELLSAPLLRWLYWLFWVGHIAMWSMLGLYAARVTELRGLPSQLALAGVLAALVLTYAGFVIATVLFDLRLSAALDGPWGWLLGHVVIKLVICAIAYSLAREACSSDSDETEADDEWARAARGMRWFASGIYTRVWATVAGIVGLVWATTLGSADMIKLALMVLSLSTVIAQVIMMAGIYRFSSLSQPDDVRRLAVLAGAAFAMASVGEIYDIALTIDSTSPILMHQSMEQPVLTMAVRGLTLAGFLLLLASMRRVSELIGRLELRDELGRLQGGLAMVMLLAAVVLYPLSMEDGIGQGRLLMGAGVGITMLLLFLSMARSGRKLAEAMTEQNAPPVAKALLRGN